VQVYLSCAVMNYVECLCRRTGVLAAGDVKPRELK